MMPNLRRFSLKTEFLKPHGEWSPKHVFIIALVLGLLSLGLSLIVALGGSVETMLARPVTPKVVTTKPLLDSGDTKKGELDVKTQQALKSADLAKVLGILNSLQVTFSGKRPLNSGFFKSIDQSSNDLSNVLKPYDLENIKGVSNLKNQTDALKMASLINQSIMKLSTAGSNLTNLSALTPSSNSFTNTNSFLDLQRLSKDSVLRKMAEAMQGYAKNIDAVQKNMLDVEALTILQQFLSLGLQQLEDLEQRSGTLNAQAKETLDNLRQTPWPSKGPQLNKDLITYIAQLNEIKLWMAEIGAIKAAAEIPDRSIDLKTKALVPAMEQKATDDISVKTGPDQAVDFITLAKVLTQVAGEMSTPKPYSNQVFPNLNKLKGALDDVLENAPVAPVQKSQQTLRMLPLKNQMDLLLLAKRIQESFSVLSSIEKSTNTITVLAGAASMMTAPNAVFDLKKIPIESPLRPLALTFDEFLKAYVLWQKNILDSQAGNNLIKSLEQSQEQIASLEESSVNQSPAVVEVLARLRQMTWSAKVAESKTSLVTLNEQLDYLKQQLVNPEKFATAAATEKSRSAISWLESRAVLYWSPMVLQLLSLLFLVLGLMRLSSLGNATPLPQVIASRGEMLEKRAPSLSAPIEVKETRPSQLVPELHAKISLLEKKFIQSYQSSEKIMSYTQELLTKVTQLRTTQSGAETGPSYVHLEVSKPLEEVDAALISLKQIGIRLFMSILENHSSRQLATETEEINILVEKTESAFNQIKVLVTQINEKALPKRHSSDQAEIDFMELDINQLLKEVRHWQEDLTNLNQTIMSLNELVDQYV